MDYEMEGVRPRDQRKHVDCLWKKTVGLDN